ncbi:MAG: Asp-tRNA(Asn)/Glu-tRNA(Gln) amidotransferase subunit GatB [Coriobacteriales bacterium]|nr:Asp-tRNA(Asn)/Glu-tRNA(Gln) amidotransferase subunit GatB [Coriobacteriales bacterium]
MKELPEIFKDWEAVIGLEVHAELTTLNTKMFCGCAQSFGDEPNTHTCPVCLGMPGALPVPNKAAIESIILAGLATNCDIEKETMFYRKGYFYPDMSKNFQTTQGPKAFCMRGHLNLNIDKLGAKERTDIDLNEDGSYDTRIGIERIHMEEDAGKMIHVGGSEGRISGAKNSFVDYNRAGTPLIELVTLPELRTPAEARAFMQKLRQVYLTLGISDCSMEKGSLRCDGNVSLRRHGETKFGTKTELKNINSFKNLHDGLEYEIKRQCAVLEDGGTILQETRHWSPSDKKTIVMRVKETADDYRMFPDPDLAPFSLTDEFIDGVRAKLPELPDEKIERFVSDFELDSSDARALVADFEFSELFEKCASELDKSQLKKLSNLIVNNIAAHIKDKKCSIKDTKLEPQHLVEIVKLASDKTLNSNSTKKVLEAVLDKGVDVAEFVDNQNLAQSTDSSEIDAFCKQLLQYNPDKVAAYKNGKTGLIGFFMGQVMKHTQGSVDPESANELLTKLLNE